MFKWIQHIHEKHIKKQQEKQEKIELERARHERLLENCRNGDHNWEIDTEIQGDGDPNIEGYILITRSRCTVCDTTEVEIEPYNRSEYYSTDS